MNSRCRPIYARGFDIWLSAFFCHTARYCSGRWPESRLRPMEAKSELCFNLLQLHNRNLATTLPLAGSDEILLDGLAYPVPAGGLPDGINSLRGHGISERPSVSGFH
jgi:hypothetical protein